MSRGRRTRRLNREDALRLVHEVACWITYEREQGSFQCVVRGQNGWSGIWQVGPLLSGACCIAAYIVVRVLIKRGYKATVRFVPGHYFARTSCGMRLDPTWGQFDDKGPRVDRRAPTKREETIAMRDMVYLPDNMEPAGCWPGHYLKPIERILRRMGVEKL